MPGPCARLPDKLATTSSVNITNKHAVTHRKTDDFFISNMICIFCPCKCKLLSLPFFFLLCNPVITGRSSHSYQPPFRERQLADKALGEAFLPSIHPSKDGGGGGVEKELCHLKTYLNVQLARVPPYLALVAQLRTVA